MRRFLLCLRGLIEHRYILEKNSMNISSARQKDKWISLAECIRRIVNERLARKKDYYEGNPLFEIGKDGFYRWQKGGSQRHDEYISIRGDRSAEKGKGVC